jgi:hypothetical protein
MSSGLTYYNSTPPAHEQPFALTMLFAFIHKDCSVCWHRTPCCFASIFLSYLLTSANLKIRIKIIKSIA